MPGIRALRVPFLIPKPTNPLSSILFITCGFAALIVLGGALLMLPLSSASGSITSPINAFFTAASAVCITGLAVVDTGTYWSIFGQGVLIILFQLGGFGFITVATLLLLTVNRRFGLKERLAITEAMGVDHLGGAIGIVAKLAVFSLIFEGIGIVIFYLRWSSIDNFNLPLWTAVFHAVSSFNNCGFDLFGGFYSLSGFQGDAVIILTTAGLVIVGSTGYIVIADLLEKRSFTRISLDSKLVIVTSFSLLILGTLFYLCLEYSNSATLGQLSLPQKLLVAFFQSVVPRTAGFTAVDIGDLQQISLFFTMFLMFIGGVTGSTGGGVKVNTLGVLWVTVRSILMGKNNVEIFGRQLTQQTVYRAVTIFLIYLGVIGLFTLVLSLTEIFAIDKILFEIFSALCTVGLSTGITPDLSIAGKIIIAIGMFVGRLGPLAFIVFLVRHQHSNDITFPRESIRLG